MITIKLNVPLKNHPKGAVVCLDTDADGVVLERYWRRRIADAETDKALEVVHAKAKTAGSREKIQ